jgi:hypothetical protein
MRTEADRSSRAKCVAEYFFVTDLALYALTGTSLPNPRVGYAEDFH